MYSKALPTEALLGNLKEQLLDRIAEIKTYIKNNPEIALFVLGLVASFIAFLNYLAFLDGSIGGTLLFFVAIISSFLILDELQKQDQILAEIAVGLSLLMLIIADLNAPLLCLTRSPLRCFYSGQNQVIISFKQILNTFLFAIELLALIWILYDLGAIFLENQSPIYKGYDFFEFKNTPQFNPRNIATYINMEDKPSNNQERKNNTNEANEQQNLEDFPMKIFREAKVTTTSFDEILRKALNKRFK